jgi:NTE family protein
MVQRVMTVQSLRRTRDRRKTHTGHEPPPFACIALLLQGGGALGAYQAGVYQALAEADLEPDWVAGISIGAINSGIIAGNPPERRVERLREFWEQVTDNPFTAWLSGRNAELIPGDFAHGLFNQLSATTSLIAGAPGFFTTRFPGPWLQPPGTKAATSYCDTSALKSTLERLIDFDRINHGHMRLSVGAVNVRSGNFAYFDTESDTIRPEHIMASGAIPPGFPAIEIDGAYYWDGGIVSNTPLQWVLEDGPRRDTLAFQVDLWSARGEFPTNMAEVAVRQKDIQYSSRTRENTDHFKQLQKLRHALAKLLPGLPDDVKETAEYRLLQEACDHSVYNIVHLIYRAKHYEGDSKDYEFSRLTMEEHWQAGYNDAVRTLRHPEILRRPEDAEGVFTFDFHD